MKADLHIYGKGDANLGTLRMAPALEPLRRELESLSSYHGSDQEPSLRLHRLKNGSYCISFAFSLPAGSCQDPRGQVRVYNLITREPPLSRPLLQALPHVTAEDLMALEESAALHEGRVSLQELIQRAEPRGTSLPPADPDLVTEMVGILFYQADQDTSPSLLARVDQDEFFAALCSLPELFWPFLRFNSNVAHPREVLGLVNAWSEQAHHQAMRNSFSGSANQRRFFYPPEKDGFSLPLQEATAFLALSPQEQRELFWDCGEDLRALFHHLQRREQAPANHTIHTKQFRSDRGYAAWVLLYDVLHTLPVLALLLLLLTPPLFPEYVALVPVWIRVVVLLAEFFSGTWLWWTRIYLRKDDPPC